MRVKATTWLMAFATPVVLIALGVVFGLLGTDPATLVPVIPVVLVAAGAWGVFNGRRHSGWTAIVCGSLPVVLFFAVDATSVDNGEYTGLHLIPGLALWLVGVVAAVFAVIPEPHRPNGRGVPPAKA